jgi:fibronectin type 3 domain-containing protein
MREIPSRALPLLTVVTLTAIAILAMSASRAAAAGDPCAPPVTNKVACENTKPGDPPSDWQIEGVGDPSIQGFATSMSVNVGQAVYFKIKTPASSYHIDILRLGYYGGDGARKIASNIQPSANLPQAQPNCLTDSSTGLIDCGNWGVSASWSVPADAVSGLYVAHLVRDDTGGESQIFFVVRDDSSHSDVVLKTSDATWEAYNAYGGNSLYTCTVSCPSGNPAGYKAAYAVSYNRPFDGTLATDNGLSDPFYAEYQLIRFLERNGYDLSYVSQHDVESNPGLLQNHKVFISSGHDEYWSAGERQGVEAARDAGVNLAFFSGNEVFWKTRWASSSDGSSTSYRTLVTYKDTHFPTPVDPESPNVTTGTWRDPRFSPPGDAGRPESSLTGQYFLVNSGTSEIKVPAAFSGLRFWRNTLVSTLTPGQTLTLSPGTGTLGYEWDVGFDNGFQPAGRISLSSTTVNGVQTFKDYGTQVENNTTATHSLSLYRAPSGALVFGAGTVQWSWGLDVTNAWGRAGPDGSAPDPTMQQATVNLMADMGAQPMTLQAGLVATSGSTDTTPPTATPVSPTEGAELADGSTVMVSGMATDAGGGVVAAVEVSTDGGSTWHPATGTSSWTYSWTVHGNPTTTIKARAVDDSGNIGAPSSGTTVSVACPCSLFKGTAPTTEDAGDASSVELGLKFRSDVAGTINGIRFYKAQANTGTHVGSLWTSTGTLLAQATFTGETASGWQQVAFATPVKIQPNTTYVAAYFAPNGHYSATEFALDHPPALGPDNLDSPPLHALPDTAGGNGLYKYTQSSVFPTSTYHSENYWVDVSFIPAGQEHPPGQATNVSAAAGALQATVNWSAPASDGGSPITEYRVTPYIGASAQTPVSVAASASSKTVTGLIAGADYTFTVTAVNAIGAGAASAPSNAVTPTMPNPPGAPTGVSATAKSSGAQVSWTAPESDGGSAITGYRITPYVGAIPQTATTTSSATTTATVSGLSNGTTYTFTVAAINAAGMGAESAPSSPVTPNATIFDLSTPAVVDSGDGHSVELGVKFRDDGPGTINGIRFYKAQANTGTHVGSLWTSTGTLLAQATFTGETASGWQQVLFATPVTIQPNTTYVAGYFAPNGHYSVNGPTLLAGVDNPPLHALANTTSPNGVYTYSSTSTFPTSSYQASNYWVDVLFTPPRSPGQATNVSATAGSRQATVNWSAPASDGGSAISEYRITPYIGASAQTPVSVAAPASSKTVTGLTPGTDYTFTVTPVNAVGAGPESVPSNAVTATAAAVPDAPTGVTAAARNQSALVSWVAPTNDGGPMSSYRITPYIGGAPQPSTTVSGSSTSGIVSALTNGTAYTFTVTAVNDIGSGAASAASGAVIPRVTIFEQGIPGTPETTDSTSVVLGVKFTSDTAGVIRGIRFYKTPGNTGTHVVSLWSSTGTLLAQATASGESASGWQEAAFASPVPIAANTTYVAAYLAPKGHYSATSQGFGSAVNSPPLHALSNTTTPNGVYSYSSSSSFPTSTYRATNYWVDVMFTP